MKMNLIIPVAILALLSGCSQRPANLVHVSGNIELTQVDMSFKATGRLVERRFDEGATVKKGDIVAQLDRDQLAQQKDRDTAVVAAADSQYVQLQTSIAMQRETLAGDIATRKANLAQAQAHLDELLNGSRPQEIQQAHAGAADAQSQFTLAKEDWDRAQTLFRNEDISRAQYEQYQARFNSAQAILHQAEHRLSLVQEGPRKEDIAGARAQVAAAMEAVKLAEANRLELQRKQEEMGQRKAAIEQAQAQAGITGVLLNDTTIRSPIDGVVLVKSAEPGEVLAAGTTVLTIGDIDHPWLRGYISERRPRPREAGPACHRHHGFVQRQNLQRTRVIHRFRRGVHAQADPDAAGAREAGVPHQDRGGEPAARAEEQHAGGSGHPLGGVTMAAERHHSRHRPDAALRIRSRRWTIST
jgi:HlyD family secretion protein